MSIEAMKQALEALEEIIHWYAVRDRNDVLLNFVDQNPEIKKSMKAITSLRQAIAEAEKQPKREWVGLTNEEISAVDWKSNETLHDFARAIEAKLKEKNT